MRDAGQHSRQASGTRHQAPGVRRQASGTRHQASGTRRQASGVRHRASGVGRRASVASSSPTTKEWGGGDAARGDGGSRSPARATRRFQDPRSRLRRTPRPGFRHRTSDIGERTTDIDRCLEFESSVDERMRMRSTRNVLPSRLHFGPTLCSSTDSPPPAMPVREAPGRPRAPRGSDRPSLRPRTPPRGSRSGVRPRPGL